MSTRWQPEATSSTATATRRSSWGGQYRFPCGWPLWQEPRGSRVVGKSVNTRSKLRTKLVPARPGQSSQVKCEVNGWRILERPPHSSIHNTRIDRKNSRGHSYGGRSLAHVSPHPHSPSVPPPRSPTSPTRRALPSPTRSEPPVFVVRLLPRLLPRLLSLGATQAEATGHLVRVRVRVTGVGSQGKGSG